MADTEHRENDTHGESAVDRIEQRVEGKAARRPR
ncbi:MAG: hypothetical protein JWP40_4104 [Blastococcus sp.]|jgi:hypothetical protein|nr:hypothetical protein [Blastococcus sp.]